MFNDFLSVSRPVYEIMWQNMVQPDSPQMAVSYSACALRVGYLRLQVHTQNVETLLLFHCNSGYTNSPQRYIYMYLPVFFLFKVCKSVQHRTIQINHQPDATIFHFIILTFIYSSTCFGRSPAHHHELSDCSSSLWFYLRIVVTVVLCSWSGRPARPRTQHGYHHDTKVKPEAATAVTELLMMGGRTPETC